MEAFAAALILSFAIVYLVVRIVAFVAAFQHGKRARKEDQAQDSITQ